jgi:hypothetical protein
MGLGDAGASTKKLPGNLRADVGGQLQEAVEIGRKISEMTEGVKSRLFGRDPQPERATPPPPVGPDSPIESIFIDGIRAIRSAQEETAKTLQEILNRL